MKIVHSVLIFLVMSLSTAATAQSKNETEVARAVETFKTAVVNADGVLLGNITADQLLYGHSSGKVQSKAEFIEEIVSKIPHSYTTIDLAEQNILVTGKTAVVRHIMSATTNANGTAGALRIGIMMVWQKQNGEWKLLARQAYKV